MGPSSHFSILASHTELLQTAVLRRPVTHSPIAATPCGGAARGFLCTGNGCRLRRRTRPWRRCPGTTHARRSTLCLVQLRTSFARGAKLVICAQGPKAHTRFHQPAQCNNVYAQRSCWLAGKFYFTRNMATIFFLQPFWFATEDFLHLKSLRRYVLVTHNKASAGPRSASACDAPNTTTRALRVSALHAVHGCAGQPLLSAEPNRTQRPIIILLSCLAGDDEVERQNAEGWTKKTRSRRVPPARGMCFACRYR